MKIVNKILLFLFSTLLLGSCKKESEIVVFQDYNFISAMIKAGIDTDGDGAISFSEASEVKTINVSHNQISEMKGIEYLVNLENLECRDNILTSLDLSKNTSLINLNCSINKLNNLEVTKNPDLLNLICGNNILTHLYISKNTKLNSLECNEMSLLYEACVWELPFPPVSYNIIYVNTTGSPNEISPPIVVFKKFENGI